LGNGAGLALHEAALDALRDAGFKRAVLWVLPENRRARHFYENLGWQTDNVERIATIRGVDVPEVRYSLNLN
jgi:RimJ/RimL family protein N-acetyltransferase